MSARGGASALVGSLAVAAVLATGIAVGTLPTGGPAEDDTVAASAPTDNPREMRCTRAVRPHRVRGMVNPESDTAGAAGHPPAP